MEIAKTILHASGTYIKLWAEGINTAIYVLNRDDIQAMFKEQYRKSCGKNKNDKITMSFIEFEKKHSHVFQNKNDENWIQNKKGFFWKYNTNQGSSFLVSKEKPIKTCCNIIVMDKIYRDSLSNEDIKKWNFRQ